MVSLTDRQIERYARHLILDEIGDEGQEKLLSSRILVVGAGGLGSPVLLYLAAAGVGTLGIVDDDRVDLSNLQRQIVHDTGSIGRLKTESAAVRLKALNPEVGLEVHARRLLPDDAGALVAQYDLVIDGSDNFSTRYALNDACVARQRPLIAASLFRFDGQLSTFKAYLGAGHPCYRCLYRTPPDPGLIPRCDEAGIMGITAGVMGTLQATEALKEILGLGESLSGTLLLYDALGTAFHRVRVPKDPTCPICGVGAQAAPIPTACLTPSGSSV